MEVFIGSMMLVPYDYAPYGFVFCDGRLLNIQQNSALFSLLGTQFGGDGKTTFGIPDLRGRVPIGAGQSPGLRTYPQALPGGAETVTLTTTQLPGHNHTVSVGSSGANSPTASGALPAAVRIYGTGNPTAQLDPNSVAPAGSNPPAGHENRPPYQVLNWIIATQGIYPVRT